MSDWFQGKVFIRLDFFSFDIIRFGVFDAFGCLGLLKFFLFLLSDTIMMQFLFLPFPVRKIGGD